MRSYLAIFLALLAAFFSFPIYGQAGEINESNTLTNKLIDLSVGASHVMAITETGMLIGWGSNNHGQIGNGTNVDTLNPLQIGTDTDWKQVYAGRENTLAIKQDGSLWAWGANSYGQLGTGNAEEHNTPTKITASTGWMKLGIGETFVLGLKKDGSLWICRNDYANGGQFKRLDAEGNWTDISVGDGHFLALKKDGSLYSWGANGNGQLGNGTIGGDLYTLQQVGSDHDWVRISAGQSFSVAQKKDGSIWKWGSDPNDDDQSIPLPKRISDGIDFTSLSTSMHTIGVKEDGTLWTLGRDNQKGQIFDRLDHFEQVGTDADWLSVHAGVGYNVAEKADGSIWAWGYNKYGQLGNGTKTDVLSPTQIGTRNDWKQISAGWYHTLAATTEGKVWAWGSNDFGKLGDGSGVTQLSPVKIDSVLKAVYVETGAHSSFALTDDHSLWGWGNNGNYELGDGSTENRYLPAQIGTDNNWKSIVSGGSYSVGLKLDGSIWFWGKDFNHDFFDGTNGISTEIKTPVQLGNDVDWSQISTGNLHILGIKKDGTLWVLGNDFLRGATPDHHANGYHFIQIGTDHDWEQAISNGSFVIGIKKDGSLWSWGVTNWFADVYDIPQIAAEPTRLSTDGQWLKVSARDRHFLLLKKDGTIWGLGNNESGQLGTGTRTNGPLLTQIGSDTNWKDISAGMDYSIGLKNDGTLWAWGSNDEYQLGLGTTNYTPEPNQIHINFPVVSAVNSNDSLVKGKTSPNSTVEIYKGLIKIAEGVSDENGQFSIRMDQQSAGTILSVVATNTEGQVSGTANILVSQSITHSSSGGGGGGGSILSQTPQPEQSVPSKDTAKQTHIDAFTSNIDITRIEALLRERLKEANDSANPSFSDTSTHWGGQTIHTFVKLGFVSGYEDDRFHPDAKITRAEFAAIVAKVFDIQADTEDAEFNDVQDHWAKPAILALVSHGIINGYEDGSFKPENTITRAEIIAILSRLIHLNALPKENKAAFQDIADAWNGDQIQAAAEAGLIEGRNATAFAPNDPSTRAESLAIIQRALCIDPDIRTIIDQIK